MRATDCHYRPAANVEAVDAELTQRSWDTPCETYTAGTGAAASSFDAAIVRTGGDGGYPVAIGYDAEGNATDVLVSTTQLPWSLLGLPGEPPPEAVRAEPTATASPD